MAIDTTDPYATGQLLHFEPVHASTADLPYADLATIDVSAFNDGTEAQTKLAKQVREAMHTDGFFTLVGMRINEAEIARQVDIGYVSALTEYRELTPDGAGEDAS